MGILTYYVLTLSLNKPPFHPPNTTAITAFLTITFAILMAVGIMNEIYKSSKSEKLHHHLKLRFLELEIKLLTSEEVTEPNIKAWIKERLEIEKDEPATYKALDALCRNELLITEGFRQKEDVCSFAKITPFQRRTAHWLRWD